MPNYSDKKIDRAYSTLFLGHTRHLTPENKKKCVNGALHVLLDFVENAKKPEHLDSELIQLAGRQALSILQRAKNEGMTRAHRVSVRYSELILATNVVDDLAERRRVKQARHGVNLAERGNHDRLAAQGRGSGKKKSA